MPVSHSSQHRSAVQHTYTPPSQVSTQIIDLGTIDRAPMRDSAPDDVPAPRGRGLEIAVGLAVFGAMGAMGLVAGGLIIGAATLTYLNTAPAIASASAAAAPALAEVTPDAPQPGPNAGTAEVATASAAAPPVQRSRGRTAPKTSDNLTQEMNLAQFRDYLASKAAAVMPAAAPVAAPVAPAPVAPPAMVTPTRKRSNKKQRAAAAAPSYDAPAPYTAPAPAPYVTPIPAYTPPPRQAAAPAPIEAPVGADEDLDFNTDPLANAAPAVAPTAVPNSDGRLARTQSGVSVLDDPLDPVALTINTDGPARISIDGQFIGAAPLGVVLEEGSHSVVIDSDKGQDTFNLDAYSGDDWCFSVRKGPKSVACNKL